MGIGASILLIAIGAILAFAVEIETEGIDLNTVGVILLIVGVVGLLASMVFWSSWGSYGVRRRTVVDDPGAVRRRTVIDERDDF